MMLSGLRIRMCGVVTLVLLSSFLVFAQNSFFEKNRSVSKEVKAHFSELVSEYVFLRLDRTALDLLLTQNQPRLRLELPLPDERILSLQLSQFEVLSPTASIVRGTEEGDKPVDIRFIAFKGEVKDMEKTLAVVTFSSTGIYGWISTPNEDYVIASLANRKGFTDEDYILYPVSKMKVTEDMFCLTEAMEVPDRVRELMATLTPRSVSPLTSDLLELEMALESDYETYQEFGSVEAATSYLLSLMATVSAVYIRDLNVKLTIVYSRVWDTPADPYTGNDSGTLLTQFRNYWNANMRFVNRDLAHYISTRPGGLGGIAWVDVLCSNPINGYGYAFSNTNGEFSDLPTYSWDVDVVSHETGHNFGSPHTHNCSWNPPIDTCWVSDENDNCVNPPPIPRVGTIMSYCHLTGSKVLQFHPLVIALIRSEAELAPCVEPSPETMLLVTPKGGEHYFSFQNVSIIWGSSGANTVDIQYSPDSGATWIDIATGINAEDREFVWMVPYISQTSDALLRIFHSDDPSQADTTDFTFTITPMLFTFELLEPPHLSTVEVAPGDNSPIDFIWSSAGSLPEIHYEVTLSYLAHTLTLSSNSNGQDTVLTLTAQYLDSLLDAWGAWNGNDSVRVRWFSTAYLNNSNQRSSNLHFLFAKRMLTTIEAPGDQNIPTDFALKQNYPNPFNPGTTIFFDLPHATRITLHVFDVNGRQVRTLAEGEFAAGSHQMVWDGRDDNGVPVASGVYLYRLTTGSGFVATRKMILLR
ncbi:MAG: T9SS C-terminal target domain-containing protein [Calditrichaeota bacterium]|nr:MAG: T9SS C-terminal target domain-containing protein [Calditrichota bacterium]